MDIGIDYGMGQTNIDRETGIRFGVINMNALSEWAWEDFESDYGPPTCGHCGNEVMDDEDLEKEVREKWSQEECEEYLELVGYEYEEPKPSTVADWRELAVDRIQYHSDEEFYCPTCNKSFDSQDAYRYEPIGHYLDDGEYKATVNSYNDVFLTKSPYYTTAQFCSPCAPGAGHLENYREGGVKTYAFGPDWFENKQPPYPVWKVGTDELVHAGPAVEKE